MKNTLALSMLFSIVISTMALAQESTLFPKRLDPEGISRSSNLAPPAILGSDTTPAARVAERQKPVSWKSVRTANGDQFKSDATKTPIKSGSETAATHSAPLIEIETIAPSEIDTFYPSNITVKVTNQGPTTAESVDLAISLTNNVKVDSTSPANAVNQNGTIYFHLGPIGNSETKNVTLTLKATDRGTVEIKPRVILSATDQITITATKPEIDVKVTGSSAIIAGSTINRQIQITNTGREIIRNLQISPHSTGNQLIGNIAFSGNGEVIERFAPGESRTFSFEATALQAGTGSLAFGIVGDNIRTEFSNPISIAQRTLRAELTGPELTYKNSTGTYSIDVVNEAPKGVENIQIVLEMPKGMNIEVVDREAHYSNNRTRLTWQIPRLEAGASEQIPFKASIRTNGSHKLKVLAVSNRQVVADTQLNAHVIGRPKLNMRIISAADAIEAGNPTDVKIEITNDGSDTASNIRLSLDMPTAIKAVAQSGYDIQDSKILVVPFDLEPGQSKQIPIRLVGQKSGEFLIRASAGSDATTTNISTESSMFFFSGLKN